MRAPACGTAPTEAAAAPMSKGPPLGRWPGWSRTAAPWAPAGGPTAPSPSPWEVTVRPRSPRHRRPARRGPARAERRARGGIWRGGVVTVRSGAGRFVWQLVGCCPLSWKAWSFSTPPRCSGCVEGLLLRSAARRTRSLEGRFPKEATPRPGLYAGGSQKARPNAAGG